MPQPLAEARKTLLEDHHYWAEERTGGRDELKLVIHNLPEDTTDLPAISLYCLSQRFYSPPSEQVRRSTKEPGMDGLSRLLGRCVAIEKSVPSMWGTLGFTNLLCAVKTIRYQKVLKIGAVNECPGRGYDRHCEWVTTSETIKKKMHVPHTWALFTLIHLHFHFIFQQFENARWLLSRSIWSRPSRTWHWSTHSGHPT